MISSDENAPRVVKISGIEEDSRIEALRLFPLESLQNLDANDARRCQAILKHGETFGVWETPEAIKPYLRVGLRRLDLRQRIVAHLPAWTETSSELDALLDEGVLWLTRLSLLMRLAPSGVGHQFRTRPLNPGMIAKNLYERGNRIVAKGIIRRLTDAQGNPEGFASILRHEDLREFNTSRYCRNELRRLSVFRDRNLWTDAPPSTEFSGKTTSPRGAPVPRPPEPKRIPYQPIPDEYLSAMGPRVLWLILDLGPNLIHLLETLPQWPAAFDLNVSPATLGKRLSRCLSNYFNEHSWYDRNGVVLTKPPFPLMHGSKRGQNRTVKEPLDPYEWPFRTWVSIATLALCLQSAHLWIALLLMAGRIGEIMTLKRDCIEWARDGKPYVNGRTYKLKLACEGEEREWPAPDILCDVLAQQVKLVAACEHLAKLRRGFDDVDFLVVDREHLWASLGSSPLSNHEAELGTPDGVLKALAIRVGLAPDPGGANLHPHRFRKTIARLGGLAIDGGPLVLMRLLGHKDITMTLGYILSDPAIVKEIDDVTRELRVMRAQNLVEDMHAALHATDSLPHGGHGGLGAAVLSAAVASHEEELHRTGNEWGVETAHELAVLLSNNGKSMRLVSQHVACTKTDGDIGLCTKKRGAANTANCQSECISRIEEKTGRRDTERVIPILVAHAQHAIKDNDLLAAANYARQLNVEIKRFDDIAAQWSPRPEVLEIMERVA